jgi:hypothetical protein
MKDAAIYVGFGGKIYNGVNPLPEYPAHGVRIAYIRLDELVARVMLETR